MVKPVESTDAKFDGSLFPGIVIEKTVVTKKFDTLPWLAIGKKDLKKLNDVPAEDTGTSSEHLSTRGRGPPDRLDNLLPKI